MRTEQEIKEAAACMMCKAAEYLESKNPKDLLKAQIFAIASQGLQWALDIDNTDTKQFDAMIQAYIDEYKETRPAMEFRDAVEQIVLYNS